MKKNLSKPDPNERVDICALAHEVVQEADRWMDLPNDQLGGKTPRELVGTPSESILRNLLLSLKYGIPT